MFEMVLNSLSEKISDTVAQFKFAYKTENKCLNFLWFNWVYFNQNELGNSILMFSDTLKLKPKIAWNQAFWRADFQGVFWHLNNSNFAVSKNPSNFSIEKHFKKLTFLKNQYLARKE